MDLVVGFWKSAKILCGGTSIVQTGASGAGGKVVVVEIECLVERARYT